MKKQIKKKLLKGFLLGTLTVCVLGMCAGCGQKTENIENTVTSPTAQEQTGKTGQKSLSWSELTQTGSMDLSYADQFSVTYYGEENYALVIIGEDEKFLVVPEGEPVPEDLPEDMHISFRRFLRNVFQHCLPLLQNQVLLISRSAGLPSDAPQSLVHRSQSVPEIHRLPAVHLPLFYSFLPLPYLHGHIPSAGYLSVNTPSVTDIFRFIHNSI